MIYNLQAKKSFKGLLDGACPHRPCIYVAPTTLHGLPRQCSGKETASQCRKHKRCGFDPWVGKIPWSRKWQPTPVFLPEKPHGQRSLVDYSPQGHKELGMARQLSMHTCSYPQGGLLLFFSLSHWAESLKVRMISSLCVHPQQLGQCLAQRRRQ